MPLLKKKRYICRNKYGEYMSKYIWQQKGWPYLTWNNKELLHMLGEVRNRQGRLAGKTSLLGLDLKKEALLNIITMDVINSAELEGITPDEDLVRASVANRLKIRLTERITPLPHIDRMVEVTMEALQNYRQPVTEETIFNWRTALGWDESVNGYHYRSAAILKPEQDADGLLYIQDPTVIPDEMRRFLKWLNTLHPTDPVIKAGVAHLRLACIHPFNKGNGQIARILTDIFLTRADGFPQHLYSMSSQISKQRDLYMQVLQRAQNGNLDITEWLLWFLYCLEAALIDAEGTLTRTLEKSKFWEKYRLIRLNERQVRMINLLWERSDCRLTSSYWANINLCSPDTALRDIQDLINKKILHRRSSGGRSTCYELN
jgi:Fic family protein